MSWITRTGGVTLKVPSNGMKNWWTGFLADFVDKLCVHDHTGSPKGLQIAAGAIATGAVTEAKIGTGAVTETKLGTGAVTAGKLGTDAVETAKIKDLNVTHAKLASDAVETANIKDGNVTAAKLDSGFSIFPIEAWGLSVGSSVSDKFIQRGICSGELAGPFEANAAVCGLTCVRTLVLSAVSTERVLYTGSSTMSFTIYKNGTTTGVTVAAANGNNYSPISDISCVAGDILSVKVTSNDDYPVGIITLWGK